MDKCFLTLHIFSLYFIIYHLRETPVATRLGSTESELPCPVFNSYLSQSPVISLSPPTVYSPLITCSADIVEYVLGIKSDSVQWMLAWGWGVTGELGRMMIRAAGALFFWSHITVQQTCVRTAAMLRCAQRPASIKRAIHLSGAASPPPYVPPPVCLTAGCTGRPERSCQPHCSGVN